MRYIKLSDETYPVSLRQIKNENMDTAFPLNPTNAQLSSYGYAKVMPVTPPVFDPVRERLVEGAPAQVGNRWDQTWTVADLPAEQMASNLVKEMTDNFEADAAAPVLSEGVYWKGGPSSAHLINGKAEADIHRGRPTGSVHGLDKQPRTFPAAKMKDIAADIADAYDAVYTKYQAKLVEIEMCGLDTNCLKLITWG